MAAVPVRSVAVWEAAGLVRGAAGCKVVFRGGFFGVLGEGQFAGVDGCEGCREEGEGGREAGPAGQAEAAEECDAGVVAGKDGRDEAVCEVWRQGVGRRIGVQGLEPTRVLGLFRIVEGTAGAAAGEVQVELALGAAGQASVQRVLEKPSGLLAIHCSISFSLDEAFGRTVRAIFSRIRHFASWRRDFTVPSGTESMRAISGMVRSS